MRRLLARLLGRLAPLAGRPLFPAAMGALALLLASPAVVSGLAFDDLFHRHYLLGRPPLDGRPFAPEGLFSAIHGDPAEVKRFVETGFAPWFTLPELRLAFFRPLSELTHRLDYALWPGAPWAMHLHSLLWLAALVVAATLLARRVLGRTASGGAKAGAAAAGLAALLVAIDCTHATATSWIASRNSVIAAAIALFALVAHDRWRRDGWRAGALVAPLLAAAALLAGEGAIALFAWLLAHALFLDSGPPRRRLLALLPCAAIGVAWQLWYRTHGYGAYGSGPYVDPASEPWRYAAAAATRAPLLVTGSLLVPQIDAAMALAPAALRVAEIVAGIFTLAVALLFAPIVRREPAGRFLALGGALSLLPISAMLPSNRLLPFVGFAAMGLLALALNRWSEGATDPSSEGAPRRRIAGALLGALAAIHLVLSPLLLSAQSLMPKLLGSTIDAVMASYPSDPAVSDDDFHVVATPDFFCVGLLPYVRDFEGSPRPRRLRALSYGPVPLRVARVDVRTLDVEFAGGLPVDFLAQLFRGPAHPMRPGDRFAFDGMTVEVLAITNSGLASRAHFTFERPLDDPHVRWFTWSDDAFVAWHPPPLGTTATIPPARAPWTPQSDSRPFED